MSETLDDTASPADQAMRVAYRADRRREADELLGASMKTDTIETVVEMIVDPPLDMRLAALNTPYRITRIKVTATRAGWPRREEEMPGDEDDRPFAMLRVYAHELNLKGEPHGQRSPVWLPILDEELAETLLGRGLVS